MCVCVLLQSSLWVCRSIIPILAGSCGNPKWALLQHIIAVLATSWSRRFQQESSIATPVMFVGSTKNTTFRVEQRFPKLGCHLRCLPFQHNMRLPPVFSSYHLHPWISTKKKKRYPQLLHRREPIHLGFVSFFFATVFFCESVVIFWCIFQHHKSPSNKMSCGSVGVFQTKSRHQWKTFWKWMCHKVQICCDIKRLDFFVSLKKQQCACHNKSQGGMYEFKMSYRIKVTTLHSSRETWILDNPRGRGFISISLDAKTTLVNLGDQSCQNRNRRKGFRHWKLE